MTLGDVIGAAGAAAVHAVAGWNERVVRHVVASDLMSDVLVVDRDHLLIVTALASEQVVRTADIVGAVGVLVVNGKTLPAGMKKLAAELALPLFSSPVPKFEACCRIGTLMK